jgi:multisubunit Na+/H+ antiporter MnhF subunit
MTPWLLFAAVLAAAGLGSAVVVGSRGKGLSRLVGLQFGGSVTVLVLVALSAAQRQASYLIVPLALVLLTYAGTLVYTRLLSE